MKFNRIETGELPLGDGPLTRMDELDNRVTVIEVRLEALKDALTNHVKMTIALCDKFDLQTTHVLHLIEEVRTLAVKDDPSGRP